MQKQYILFDLDGTLTDSAEGIINSALYALDKFGINDVDRSRLKAFIGPPLHDSFEKFCGFTRAQADMAVGYFREYYKTRGMYENQVYCGIENTLKELSAGGKTLIVATSKAEVFAKKILEQFRLDRYFAFTTGSELDGTRSEKEEVIAYTIERCDITDLDQAVMVGDREYDIIGAAKNGIDSIGVLYGYGSLEELQAAGATRIVKNCGELTELLLS